MAASLFVLGYVIILLTTLKDCVNGQSYYRGSPTVQDCDVKMRIYDSCSSSRYLEYCVEDSLQLYSSPLYNPRICNTVLLAIPFYNNVSHYNVQRMLEALTSRCEFNIILLDNSVHTNAALFTDYAKTMFEVYEDSKRFAKALNGAIDKKLLSASCLVGMGFSLGAQIIGQVCRHLTQKCCNLYAIDAAGPLFLPSEFVVPKMIPQLQLVSKSDACRVVSINCNSGFLGTSFHMSHVNIIVNSGIFQPDCSGLTKTLCDHMFCNQLMANAIRQLGACVARNCGTKLNYVLGSCSNEYFTLGLPSTQSCGSCNDRQEKIFQLHTSSDGRCIGKDGANDQKTPTNLLKDLTDQMFG